MTFLGDLMFRIRRRGIRKAATFGELDKRYRRVLKAYGMEDLLGLSWDEAAYEAIDRNLNAADLMTEAADRWTELENEALKI